METVPQTMIGDAGLLGSLPQLQSPVSFRPALRQLHRQRRETATLRELWHSLAVKRERRLQELKAKACPAVSQQDIPTAVLEQPSKKHTPQVNESVQEPTTSRQDDSFTKSALQVDSEAKITADTEHPLPAIRSISKTDVSAAFSPLRPYRSAAAVPTLRSKTSQERNTASRFQRSKVTSSSHHFRHDDVKSPVPYHTAITRRPERTCSPRFQALTQVCSTPLPHLMEGGVPKSQTPKPGPDAGSKRDIREWQNEIVKVVPARPEFFQRLPNGFKPSKVMTFRYPYKVINIDPSCLFYRSYSKIRDKEYVISPEWSSEKHPLRAGIATRAKTDLCLRHDVKRK